MFKVEKIELQRIGVAAIGALVLTAASVGAAVAPARAVEMDRSIQVAQASADRAEI